MRRVIVSSSPACFDTGAQGLGIDAANCWLAWFDGAALPNPGKMGIGVVLVSPDGQHADRSGLIGGSGCNNEAELHALCIALEMASGAGAQRLIVRGDSDVAVRYVNGPDSTDIARLAVLVRQARNWLPRFEAIQLVWIPRHRNAEADRLSRQALGLPVVVARVAKRRRR